MSRQAPKARDRIRRDAEIRSLWTGVDGMFGDFTKLLLLTGQRRDKVATLKWADLDEAGVWTLETEDREKNNTGSITLPQRGPGPNRPPATGGGLPRAVPRARRRPHQRVQQADDSSALLSLVGLTTPCTPSPHGKVTDGPRGRASATSASASWAMP